jgi:hypothetical protein
LLAMVANDDAPCLTDRGVPAFFASWLAPAFGLNTSGGDGLAVRPSSLASQLLQWIPVVLEVCGHCRSSVGASLLAMVVNDDALCLNGRGVPAFFASWLAPTFGLNTSGGDWLAVRPSSLASQLLQWISA